MVISMLTPDSVATYRRTSPRVHDREFVKSSSAASVRARFYCPLFRGLRCIVFPFFSAGVDSHKLYEVETSKYEQSTLHERATSAVAFLFMKKGQNSFVDYKRH